MLARIRWIIAHLRRTLVRRRLRPLISVVPMALEKDHGRRKLYTYAQLKQCLERHRVSSSLMPVAAAVYCNYEEFRRIADGLSQDDYHALRGMFADHFGLDENALSTEIVRRHAR